MKMPCYTKDQAIQLKLDSFLPNSGDCGRCDSRRCAESSCVSKGEISCLERVSTDAPTQISI